MKEYLVIKTYGGNINEGFIAFATDHKADAGAYAAIMNRNKAENDATTWFVVIREA